jgi:DNA helicase-2/ATP-dependent DNA helicase PcrA
VPYVIDRGTAFYDSKEIKDALDYLRMLANAADDVAFRRIVNSPARGIGESTIKRLEAIGAATGRRLDAVCGDAGSLGDLATRSRKAVERFATTVAGWRAEIASGDSTGFGDLVARVLRESGLEKPEAAFESEDERQRQANLGELVSAAEDFIAPSFERSEDGTIPMALVLREYLESVALVSDADAIDAERGAVTLMTLHAAKGLEYHAVAMVGLEDGLLPHTRARESELELEEERRLCFVGMTRAERHLLMTCAGIRTMRGMRQPTIRSQFLDEIPEGHRTDHDFGDEWGGLRKDDDGDDRRIEYDDVDDPESLPAAYRAGTVVRHQQFGTGVVASFSHRGRVHSVVVDFKVVGRKTLVLEYAKLQRVEF